MTPTDSDSIAGTGLALAVSPHQLASDAAADILRQGGNAVDAAVALNAVLGVVLPTTCGIGGDLFALVHEPGADQPAALNASGRAGSRASADELRARGHIAMPLLDNTTITIPGCVDGWEALLARYGSMTLAQVLAPAIALALDGFPASRELSMALARVEAVVARQASGPPLYPGGAPPAPNTELVRPYIAETLRLIGASGRAAFYQGEPGAAISQVTDGAITQDDLAAGQAAWVDAIGIDVWGSTGWTMPPNSQGYMTLAAAWILEQLEPPPDPSHPAYHHAAIEAYRAVASERDRVVADPDSAPLAPDELLDPTRLKPFFDQITDETVTPWPAPSRTGGGTAFMCVVDREGLGVSLVQSNFHGIGTGLSAGATGVFLHNRGAGFSLQPGHPNEFGPGKRPLHTLSPTLWTRGGDLELILGTRGGHQQPQLLLQVAAHLHHARLRPRDAQREPRWNIEEVGPTAESHVVVEHDFEAVAGLSQRGHHVALAPSPSMPGWGPVAIIAADHTDVPAGSDSFRGAADPRISTAAVSVAEADGQ